ncbi:uncharacterized protein BKA55DRAFT_590021 [Fusarium redolens]|uniref:Chitin deacetylase n=1 Tax=Fusarium redolens TaxID=48865 RepID=A0A9P9KSF0_FUSRE|nr:uncharacterized protein BKA55DRAFT_590021 [Fusarium redolens]KAH7267676.1 hypothetical protein BKA55DRAFT_590021 [Fusarium redolens]
MKASLSATLTSLLVHAGTVLSGPVFAADDLLSLRDSKLRKRAECGLGIGSCNPGSCCSESGFCGTTGDFCGGSACQLEYSDSCDTLQDLVSSKSSYCSNGHEADTETSFGPRGSSTEGISRPRLGNVPYETGTIITTCTAPGVIALTFDDGPLEYTNDLLDLLDDRDIQATFFVAGNNRAKGHIDDSSKPWPAVMRRMYSAGHHIASHTWTHRNLNEVNSTIRRSEMIYNEMAFRNLFGWIPTYMRAPYLECNAASGCLDEMSELGYHVVDQNIDTKDYENDSPALIQISKDRYSSGVSSNSENNQYIVLAHDVHDQTVHNLTASMIDTAQDRGYRLVTVGECLGDPRENWYRTVSRGRDATSTESATTTRTVPPTNVSVTTNTATATGGLDTLVRGQPSEAAVPGMVTVDRVKVTVEQAVIPTLGRARLPEVTFTTLPTAFVVLASGHHAETTVTRPAALSTGSAAIVLLTAELVVRGALESVTDVYDYPSIGC